MFKKYDLKCYNFRLMFYTIAATVIGLFVIESAVGGSFFWKQMFGLTVGVVLMLVISLIDYRFILRFYWVLYAFNIIILFAVKLFGKEVGGAKRWIPLGNSFSLQPSEFAKVILILFLAKMLATYREKLNTAKFLCMVALVLAFPIILIVTQPDLSTTVLIFLVLATMIYCAGLSYKIIGVILGIAIPLFVAFFVYIQNPDNKIFFLEDYQLGRIRDFFNGDNGDLDKQRQQIYSVQAIGSGQLNGKGLNNDDPTSMLNAGYIYEPQTDFIFAVIGEELGFLGGVLCIGILALIVFECILEAIRTRDFEGRLICCGMAALITFQTFINIGVATRMLPNTGLPLPFYSYGLSSMVSLFSAFGIVLNIHLSRYEKKKDNTLRFEYE